ncbi:hypothetical protein C0989_001595 [Termitomyces sp. Mn162]|nr:hypothetical protein C0989_001595 [Termitomyces sp. Mn162]
MTNNGTSTEKGKGPDPGNWGNADLSREDLEPEVQRHILDECNAHRDRLITEEDEAAGTEDLESEDNDSEEEASNHPTRQELRKRLHMKRKLEKEIQQMKKELKEKRSKRSKRAGSEPISHELQDMITKVTHRARSLGRMGVKETLSKKLRPVNQVARNSALGRAFNQIRKEEGSDPSDSEPSSPSESSDSSSSEDTDSTHPSSESEESDWSMDPLDQDTRKTQEKHKKRSPKTGNKKIPRSLIKPTLPAKYSGVPDLQAFLQFMTHCTSYVKYGLVQREQQVLVVSEFLTGRAWTFYSREASRAPEEWTLEQFFKELFNDCFPINYCNKQRNKLQHLRQGKMTVH